MRPFPKEETAVLPLLGERGQPAHRAGLLLLMKVKIETLRRRRKRLMLPCDHELLRQIEV
jgi:hypothetical protein